MIINNLKVVPDTYRDKKMEVLVKCSLCGRDVSSECQSCPGCGHNVAHELYQKEQERKEDLEKRGLCPLCGSNVKEITRGRYYSVMGGPSRKECDEIWKACTKCHWSKMIRTTNWTL